jgi:hypothetical protein
MREERAGAPLSVDSERMTFVPLDILKRQLSRRHAGGWLEPFHLPKTELSIMPYQLISPSGTCRRWCLCARGIAVVCAVVATMAGLAVLALWQSSATFPSRRPSRRCGPPPLTLTRPSASVRARHPWTRDRDDSDAMKLYIWKQTYARRSYRTCVVSASGPTTIAL